MVKENIQNKGGVHVCESCCNSNKNKKSAEKCEAWCKKYRECKLISNCCFSSGGKNDF